MKKGFRLDLDVPADWDRIDPIRQAVQLCIQAVFGESELKDALAMVAAELLENAVKYGASGAPAVRFSMVEEAGAIRIDVSNAIEERSVHLDTLKRRIEWVKGFDDPAEAYMSALAQVYAELEGAEPSNGPTGGLGLVRVAYEGGCDVDASTPGSGWVTVTARHRLSGTATH